MSDPFSLSMLVMWVKQCHVYHPPRKIIIKNIGGMSTYHSQSWVVSLWHCFTHITKHLPPSPSVSSQLDSESHRLLQLPRHQNGGFDEICMKLRCLPHEKNRYLLLGGLSRMAKNVHPKDRPQSNGKSQPFDADNAIGLAGKDLRGFLIGPSRIFTCQDL